MSVDLPQRQNAQRIVEHVVAGLRALELPDLGDRVWGNRRRPFWRAGLAGCNVFKASEKREVRNSAPRSYKRTLQIVIELAAAVRPAADGAADEASIAAEPDQILDRVALSIERWLEHDQTLGGLAYDSRHTDALWDMPEQGDERYGFLRLIEEVEYYTDAAEEILEGLDPLRQVHIETHADNRETAAETDILLMGPQ